MFGHCPILVPEQIIPSTLGLAPSDVCLGFNPLSKVLCREILRLTVCGTYLKEDPEQSIKPRTPMLQELPITRCIEDASQILTRTPSTPASAEWRQRGVRLHSVVVQKDELPNRFRSHAGPEMSNDERWNWNWSSCQGRWDVGPLGRSNTERTAPGKMIPCLRCSLAARSCP